MAARKPGTVQEPPQVVIVDPHNVPIAYVDWFITGGPASPEAPVLNIALGSVDHVSQASGGPLAVVVGARLRFSREFAESLRDTLDDMIAGQAPAPTKNQIN